MGTGAQSFDTQNANDDFVARRRKMSWWTRWKKRRRKYRRKSLFRRWLDIAALTLVVTLVMLPVWFAYGQLRHPYRDLPTYNDLLIQCSLALVSAQVIAGVGFFIWKYEDLQRRKWR